MFILKYPLIIFLYISSFIKLYPFILSHNILIILSNYIHSYPIISSFLIYQYPFKIIQLYPLYQIISYFIFHLLNLIQFYPQLYPFISIYIRLYILLIIRSGFRLVWLVAAFKF
jgi:hypothetical protein